MSNNGGSNKNMEKAIAKTAGIIVFSGIAFSLLKTAFNPYNKQQENTSSFTPPLEQSIIIQEPIIFQKPIDISHVSPLPSAPLSSRTVKIVKGDTLWGLAKKHGVSVDAIKEANGITGNTIYAGKKLIIPDLF